MTLIDNMPIDTLIYSLMGMDVNIDEDECDVLCNLKPGAHSLSRDPVAPWMLHVYGFMVWV